MIKMNIFKNIKNKKRKILVFLIATLVLLLSGCGSQKNDEITNVDIRKGTDGLVMEFLKNAPPENVFENGKFPISLKIKNIGASDIKDNNDTPEIEGGLLVFGFEKAYITMTSPKSNISIPGKSIFNPKGDEMFITSDVEAKQIGAQSETHPSTILATACYPYNTTLDVSICIDTDILGQRRGVKACTVRDLSFSNGQGAPVTITKIETRMLPQDETRVKPHFLIYVENAGNGEVIKNGKAEAGDKSAIEKACSSEPLSYKDFNTIKAKASLSGIDLDCSPEASIGPGEAEIRLKDKEDLIRCTYETADKDGNIGINANLDAYVTQLKIELNYGYTFTISKDIIIEKVLTH